MLLACTKKDFLSVGLAVKFRRVGLGKPYGPQRYMRPLQGKTLVHLAELFPLLSRSIQAAHHGKHFH